jgi:NTE family protein
MKTTQAYRMQHSPEALRAFFAEEDSLLKFAQHDYRFLDQLKVAIDEMEGSLPLSGFSDIRSEEDGKPIWYVDLVQEGGGVLGIALVGYVYMLEKAGIRFLSMAGTSAGAINTVLMAAAAPPEEAKAGILLEKLASMDLSSFQDGNWFVKVFIQALTNIAGGKGKGGFLKSAFQKILNLAPLLMSFPFAWYALRQKLGLHPGKAFEAWLKDGLQSFGIQNIAELEARMRDTHPEVAQQLAAKNSSCKLAFIASDLTTQSKVEFPKDGRFYLPSERLTLINPAEYVRASMSVPIFFYPKTFSELPQDLDSQIEWIFHLKPGTPVEEEIMETWGWPQEKPQPGEPRALSVAEKVEALKCLPEQEKREWIEKQGIALPEKVQMIDGGIISNFPIDLFHCTNRLPTRPTFGVKLGIDHENINQPEETGPIDLMAIAFETARMARDADFIAVNPDFAQLVKEIEIGPHFWLDFNLTEEAKRDLFRRGAKAASEFLQTFDWEAYKNLRAEKLVSAATNLLGYDLDQFITKAETARQVAHATPQERQVLKKRVQLIKLQEHQFRVLWISDSSEGDEVEMEVIRSMGGQIELAESSDEARGLMARESYDLVISDIDRDGQTGEGVRFIQEVHQSRSLSPPPCVFYISDLDKSRGTPAYAQGITNRPVELLHLVGDVIERKPQQREQELVRAN